MELVAQRPSVQKTWPPHWKVHIPVVLLRSGFEPNFDRTVSQLICVQQLFCAALRSLSDLQHSARSKPRCWEVARVMRHGDVTVIRPGVFVFWSHFEVNGMSRTWLQDSPRLDVYKGL